MKKFAVLILMWLAASLGTLWAATPGEVEVGGVLREAQMQGLVGPSRKLSAYRGKPLLINVWASWCGPCREEMGSLERLNRLYGGQQFNVIGISTDDYRDKALGFLQSSNVTFNNYLDSKLLLENMLGANRLPLTVMVDAQGKVLGKVYGAREWDSPQALAAMAKLFGVKF